MIIERTSKLTGVTRSMDIPVTTEQLSRWREGELIQVAMPDLTSSEREFLMTGITPEEWDTYFGENDDL